MKCCRRKCCYILVSILVIALLTLGAFWRLSTIATSPRLQNELNTIDQDPTLYVGQDLDKPLMTAEQQAQVSQAYIRLYFSPWLDKGDLNQKINTKLLQTMQVNKDFFSTHETFMFTYIPFTQERINYITSNMDFSGFPQINRPAIITHITPLRVFPTNLPNYNDPKKAGEGYPFDNWMMSYLFPGAPVRVLQISKDQLWYFVRTGSAFGWIPVKNLGFVDAAFMAEWHKYSFVVTNKNSALPGLRKGMIYPSPGRDETSVKVLWPFRDNDGNAHIETLAAAKSDVLNFPIPLTEKNVAEMAKTFINEPYGWGNLYQLRDCSSTTQDIFAGFGLWLPRNSSQQSRLGEVVILPDATKIRARRKIIVKKGVPFLTLIHFPGHITLYIGSRDGNPYVQQEIWGLRTTDLLGREGRVVIGKTVITPLDFAKRFSNTTRLQISKATDMSIFNADSYRDETAIKRKVWHLDN